MLRLQLSENRRSRILKQQPFALGESSTKKHSAVQDRDRDQDRDPGQQDYSAQAPEQRTVGVGYRLGWPAKQQ